jgi:hypothetical protein
VCIVIHHSGLGGGARKSSRGRVSDAKPFARVDICIFQISTVESTIKPFFDVDDLIAPKSNLRMGNFFVRRHARLSKMRTPRTGLICISLFAVIVEVMRLKKRRNMTDDTLCAACNPFLGTFE